jgi:polysaccharide export outer membrane protein
MIKVWLCLWAFVIGFGSVQTVQAADILLGPGDVIRVIVYGSPDLSLETRVSEAGKISFPLIGEVEVNQLSSQEAEKKIAGLLSSGGFLRNPQVSINVTSIQSQQISVLGQVNRPGRYPVEGKRTLTDILALAGGANPDGADQVTLIRKRDGNVVRELIDLPLLLRNGNIDNNPVLAGNDIVYVERSPRFYVFGEVQRPSVYRLERNMTVLQALSVAGGLTQRGTERGLQIKRRDNAGKVQVIKAKLDDLVLVDDVVLVQESLF